jgi:predicted ATP-grasp superfamily ATP-dependent carboligase
MIVLNNAKVIDITSFKKGEYKAILGFAGAGFVGNTSVMFAARSKGYKLVAKVKSFDIPPMILLIDGNPTSSFRIYVDEVDGLLFAVTETLVPAEA